MRTPDEYLASLRDGREVWFRGEKVGDVTAHPELGVGARNIAQTYEVEARPEWADLFWVEEDGRRISRFYKIPRNSDDLLRRHEAIEHLTREVRPSLAAISKEIGSDALFALLITSRDVDRKYGTRYFERVRAYYEYARDNELDLAVAQTDVKGDRSLRPADQPNPDTYLRIVERRPDGLVVRGAKVHTTDAVYAHEIIVLPTRAMTERDRDYAVAFAVPVNTPGVRLVASTRGFTGQTPFDNPVAHRFRMVESVTIFDNVFVPNDRVFLAGEWDFAGDVAKTFVEFHRFTACAYKPPLLEALVGLGALLAEYNGIERVPHVRDKLARLIMYLATVRSMTRAAALDCRARNDIAVPNPVVTNAAKFYFADNYHAAVKCVQDIAGGLVVTGPAAEDFNHPELKPLLDHYLAGKAGVSGEERLRAINLARDLVASDLGGYLEVLAIHAEGSLETQKLTVLMDTDLAPLKAYARWLAGIVTERPSGRPFVS